MPSAPPPHSSSRSASGARPKGAATVHWQRSVPQEIRALDTLVDPSYTDFFTAATTEAQNKTAEEWARLSLEGAPPALRLLVFVGQRFVLGLRVKLRRSPDRVIGWKIGASGDDYIRMETGSWLMTPHLILKVDEDRISVATLIRYDHPMAARIWPPVSLLHRRVGIALLGHALKAQ